MFSATIALQLAVTLASCGGGEGDGLVTVVDSSGVAIVSNGAERDHLEVWKLTEEPEASIGQLAGDDPAHLFSEVRGAVRLSDGRLVVGDWGSKEARYFDARGNHVLTVGGAGEGPGELRLLYRLDRIVGDTVVVGGWPIGSRYWFDEKGGFIRAEALGPWFPGLLGRTLPDGALILDTYEYGSYGNTLETWAQRGPDNDLRPQGVLELVSRDGSTTDSIGEFRGQTWHKVGEIGQTFAMHALPFSPTGMVAWSRDLVFVGHGERAEVRAFRRDGELVRIMRWDPAPVAVRAADRTTFSESVLGSANRPGRLAALRRWLSEIEFPAVMPAFVAMISADDGWLWVRDSSSIEDDLARWTVYRPDGTAGAVADLPAAYEVLAVDSTHIVARSSDDFGVEYVWAHRIIRGSGRD